LSNDEEKLKELMSLKSVGKAIAEKMIECGYTNLQVLPITTSEELSLKIGISKSKAKKIIEEANEKLGYVFKTVDDIYKERKNIRRLTTGSHKLDELLGGGVETGILTEVYGASRSGKTQLAHQLCVSVQLPVAEGGFYEDSNVPEAIFIDCEGTFRPERIAEMSMSFGLNANEVMTHIQVARAHTSEHQILLSEQIPQIIMEKNIQLVVIDSVTTFFRSEFTKSEIVARQDRLNKHLNFLKNMASTYNIIVFLTNQVMANPDAIVGDSTVPVGGHVLSHKVQTRLYLREVRERQRVARLMDSSYLPPGQIAFFITPAGIRDAEDI